MASNDFLPFAAAGGANVVTQATYAGLAALSTGYQSGVANSAQLNKTWRQSSIMAAVLAQLIADTTGANATDDGTTATLLSNLKVAIRLASAVNAYGLATGTANAHVLALIPALTARIDGMVLSYKAPAANTGALTLNDGIGAASVVGANHSALQGGETVANGDVWVQWNSSIGGGSYIMLDSTGGALPVVPGTQSNHAVNLGQFPATAASNGIFAIPCIVAGVKTTFYCQWFSLTLTTTPTAYSFPVAFPNNAYQIIGSPVNAANQTIAAGVTSKTQFTAQSSLGTPGCSFFVIGS